MPLTAATWDGQKLVTVVSRYSGIANDTAVSRAVVLDHLNLGLWEISLQTSWSWYEVQSGTITVVSGTATYSLTATANGFSSTTIFDEIYDVRLVGVNERTLEPIDRRTYDRYRRRFQSTTSTPSHYLLYGAQLGDAVITLLPTPSAGDSLAIRFLQRQTVLSDATSSTLAIPDKYIPLVVYKACQLTAAWKDPERVGYWEQAYLRVLARAMNINAVPPDANVGFVPRVEWASERGDFVSPTDLDAYPRG